MWRSSDARIAEPSELHGADNVSRQLHVVAARDQRWRLHKAWSKTCQALAQPLWQASCWVRITRTVLLVNYAANYCAHDEWKIGSWWLAQKCRPEFSYDATVWFWGYLMKQLFQFQSLDITQIVQTTFLGDKPAADMTLHH